MTSDGGGGAVEVDGPATLDDEATAAFAGVGGMLKSATGAEAEEEEELVVTVVSGVISPGE